MTTTERPRLLAGDHIVTRTPDPAKPATMTVESAGLYTSVTTPVERSSRLTVTMLSGVVEVPHAAASSATAQSPFADETCVSFPEAVSILQSPGWGYLPLEMRYTADRVYPTT